MSGPEWATTAVAAWYAGMSITSALAYGLDKRAASRGNRRIAECRLLALDLLGGWPGGWLAQRMFHHKSRKRTFMWRFRAIVLAHALVWGAVLWWRFGPP